MSLCAVDLAAHRRGIVRERARKARQYGDRGMCEKCGDRPPLRFVALGETGWTRTEFECWALAPHPVTGEHHNARTRAELEGAPTFRDWLGPMWDGDAIRYENAAAYDALSI